MFSRDKGWIAIPSHQICSTPFWYSKDEQSFYITITTTTKTRNVKGINKMKTSTFLMFYIILIAYITQFPPVESFEVICHLIYYSYLKFLNKVALTLKLSCPVFLTIFYIESVGINIFISNVGEILSTRKSSYNDGTSICRHLAHVQWAHYSLWSVGMD